MSPEVAAIYAATNAEAARVMAMQAANMAKMMEAMAIATGSAPQELPYNENSYWVAAANLDNLAMQARNAR